MRVSPHPPHRSRRAELPHRALASGNDAKTNLWIGVVNSGGRKPLGNQTLHPFPFQVILLATAPQNLHPHPTNHFKSRRIKPFSPLPYRYSSAFSVTGHPATQLIIIYYYLFILDIIPPTSDRMIGLNSIWVVCTRWTGRFLEGSILSLCNFLHIKSIKNHPAFSIMTSFPASGGVKMHVKRRSKIAPFF